VFPSPAKAGAPLSDMTLAAVLKRMGRADVTVHGFRSTFRDWAGEATAHPREVVEAALAHRLQDKAEAAYARGDLFAKRRKLMEDWAARLARDGAAAGAEGLVTPRLVGGRGGRRRSARQAHTRQEAGPPIWGSACGRWPFKAGTRVRSPLRAPALSRIAIAAGKRTVSWPSEREVVHQLREQGAHGRLVLLRQGGLQHGALGMVGAHRARRRARAARGGAGERPGRTRAATRRR
jgi:hypothetical protein